MKKFLLFIALGFFLTSCQKKTILSLNLKKGEEYVQVQETKMLMSQKVYNQNIDITTELQGVMIFKVLEENKEDFLMEGTFKELKMKMIVPYSPIIEVDTSKEPENLFSEMMAAITNNPFIFTLSKRGEIIEMKDIERMIKEVFETQFSDIPPLQKEQLMSQILKYYSEDSYKGNFEIATRIFPENAVKVGDQWVINKQLLSGFQTNITSTYTLTEINDDYVLLKEVSKMKSIENLPYETPTSTMEHDLSGNAQSTIKVDKNTGWIILSENTQAISGEVLMINETAQNTTMEMQIETDTKISGKIN